MRNCIIGQSGGPTVAINASLAGVISQALQTGKYAHIYGMINGIQGLMELKVINLGERLGSMEKLEQLSHTPAMYLGSCRYKLPETEETDMAVYEQLFSILKNLQIDDFFYIGGNDSMDTIMKLSDYGKKIGSPIRFIGIPKTIDNDLMGTDHTPGFGSAAKYIATLMLEVMHDSSIYQAKSVTIVEIMGRNAGWLTAAAALARTEKMGGVDLIYLPEVPFDREEYLKTLEEIFASGKEQVVVAVSEGIRDKSGEYVNDGQIEAKEDAFGHISRSGAGKAVEHMTADYFGCKVRSIEVNVLQRSSMHCASAVDLEEAFLIGEEAVNHAIEGENGIVLGYRRMPGSGYRVSIQAVDVHEVANLEKRVPREWINEEGNHVNGTMINYLLPLVQGEVILGYKNGIPDYLER